MECKFDKAWIGPCKVDSGASEFCEKHAAMKCCSCGEQATRECDHTGIQFVCGYPLCATCQHGRPPKGNPGMLHLGGGHVTADVHEQQWADELKAATLSEPTND